MNPQLDRRLGRIWSVVEQRLGLEESRKFLDLIIKAQSFDDLLQTYKDLVLEIEGGSKASAA